MFLISRCISCWYMHLSCSKNVFDKSIYFMLEHALKQLENVFHKSIYFMLVHALKQLETSF